MLFRSSRRVHVRTDPGRFAEKQRHLAKLHAPFADPRPVDQNVVRLKEHPVVELDPQRRVANFQIHTVAPGQRIAARFAGRNAGYLDAEVEEADWRVDEPLGFVETVRGRQGGLALACDPAAINLGAVVRACEEDMALVECFDPATNHCCIAPACALTGIAQEALEAFLTVFDRYTLADLAAPQSRLSDLLARI